MQVVRTIADCRAERAKLSRKKVAIVPTMGALHAGHLSLVDAARTHASAVVVTVFVNPTQFGPKEDYQRYPRPIEDDLAKCEAAGVDVVFHPSADEMYRPGSPDVVVDVPALTTVLEGKHRPGHFKGVCQVVAKLFNIVRPSLAFFGQKDYQQFRVLSAMVEALDLPIDVRGVPTLRDADGLAMSSRNQYLSAGERERALSISRAFGIAQGEFKTGVRQTNRLVTTMQHVLLEQHLSIDYIAAVDAYTLKSVELVTAPTVFAIAARVGKTRLIDNAIVNL